MNFVFEDKFSIDPNNGWISLIKDGVLTADEYPVHAIKVQAKVLMK